MPSNSSVLLAGALAALLAVLPARAAEPAYSWQKPHAKVLPSGGLEWSPAPFQFTKGGLVRYIDFESGSDDNDGTREHPWKHHPWDPSATGAAQAGKGPVTYVFKRGVIYRGRLVARESGVPGNPIRLTSDPSWGEGDACIYGSERIRGGWQRCSPEESTAYLPEPENVWFIDLGTGSVPRALWIDEGASFTRIPMARTPNWTWKIPNDPLEGMMISGFDPGLMKRLDPQNHSQRDPAYFDGMYRWSEYRGDTGTFVMAPVKYDPQTHSIGAPEVGCRVYYENHASFLDAQNEFYFEAKGPRAGRLFLRLPEGKDPNTLAFEVPRQFRLIYLPHTSNVEITGLRFSFDDVGPRFDQQDDPNRKSYPAAIYLMGSCENVRIANNQFYRVMSGIIGLARGDDHFNQAHFTEQDGFGAEWRRSGPDTMRRVIVSDNDFNEVDRRPVSFEETSPSVISRISILRNRIDKSGFRGTNFGSDDLPAIALTGVESCEIAGNMISHNWGSGIVTSGGKSSKDAGQKKPFTRILIHHNRVVDSFLATCGGGAITQGQGGPAYIYCNVSGNAKGWPMYTVRGRNWSCKTYGYSLDGAFKSYVFNNIAFSLSSDPNALDPMSLRGFMQGPGFLNEWFNNSGSYLRDGFSGWAGERCIYTGNAFENVGAAFAQETSRSGTDAQGLEKRGEVNSLAYTKNILGKVSSAGSPAGLTGTLEELRTQLATHEAMATDLGESSTAPLFAAADKHDFRPGPGSAVLDKGVKVFVPWSLYAVAGEWSFCRFNSDPSRVTGENSYMTGGGITRNDLTVPGAKADWYEQGPLEDWTAGVLTFDGKSRYAVLTDASLRTDWSRPAIDSGAGEEKTVSYPESKRRTVDMGENNFLVEVYFRTRKGNVKAPLVSKLNNSGGYEIGVGGKGIAGIGLRAGNRIWYVNADNTAPVNDGKWHHVVVEVDRLAQEVRIHVDGKTSSKRIDLSADVSLTSSADFFVGKGGDGTLLDGAIDFVRVARGTLADAETTIDELRSWEFDGPFLRDFTGKLPAGKCRDAGALESAGK